METEGPQGEEGRQGLDPASNVVQFPRDWFGPKDELVPFGPSASQTGTVDLEAPTPVRPDDFWGEDSAAIHHVLQVPELDEVGAPAGVGSGATLRSSASVLYARARRRLRPLWARRPAVAPIARRYVLIAAGGLAVLACSAFLVGRFGASRGNRLERAAVVKGGGSATAVGAEAFDRPSQAATEGSPRLLLALHRPTSAGHAAARRHVGAARSDRRRGSRSGAPAHRVSSAGDQAPAYGAEPVSTRSAVESGSSASGSSASVASGSSGASPAAGPQGAGAPFGPGHLG